MVATTSAAPSLKRHPEDASSARGLRSLTVFGVPALLWYTIFMIGPLIAVFALSFYNWPGMIAPRTFVGLAKYRQVLADPVFHQAIRNTLIQVLIAVPVMIPLAFMLGYYLQLRPKGRRVLSVLFFTPGLISVSAKAMLFVGVLSPRGIVNSMLTTVGLEDLTRSWLADTSTALSSIIFVDLWSGIGWTAVLFSARLASVPGEIYEAAELDGCGHWRTMWRVAMPASKDFVGVASMLQFVWTLFNSAALVMLLTRGGPGTSSTTLSYLVYSKAFVQQDIGYSQVVAVVLFITGLLGMGAIRFAFREKD